MAEFFLAGAGYDEEVQHMIQVSDAEARANSGHLSGSDDHAGDGDIRDHIVVRAANDSKEDLEGEGSVAGMTLGRRSTQVVPPQPMTW